MNDLCLLSARELVELTTSGKLSVRELLDAHFEQIERVNPLVNAIITRCDDLARARAKALDDQFVSGAALGPLYGLPVAHKDTHRTAGIRTTFGSPIHADLVPEVNELIVERIVEAGAVTIGKTNVPEFAAGSHTFNPLFGATRNPFDPAKSAGGSTGGGAAAVVTGMQALADGSDMGGSLRNPASFCNLVGLRPSVGRVPSTFATDPWGVLSVEGAIARSADDLALVMSAISGEHAHSPLAMAGEGRSFAGPIGRDLTGIRVALSPTFGGLPVDAEVQAAVLKAGAFLEQLGARVEMEDPDLGGADEVFRVLRALAFDVNYGPLLDLHRAQMKASLVDNIEQGRALTEERIVAALRRRGQLFSKMAGLFDRFDLLVGPTSQVLPFDIELEYPTEVAGVPTADYLSWMPSCYLISVTGNPACSVPVSFSASGLPIGVQLVGRPREDHLLLQVAHGIEGAGDARARRPSLLDA